MALFGQKGPQLPPGVAECEKSIEDANAKKRELIFQIGAQYSIKYTPETSEKDFEPYLTEIHKLDEKISNLEVKKLAIQGLRKCEKCGNILPVDSAFCNKCGDKLDPIDSVIADEEDTQSNGTVCPKCGAAIEEGALFCTVCGQKIV